MTSHSSQLNYDDSSSIRIFPVFSGKSRYRPVAAGIAEQLVTANGTKAILRTGLKQPLLETRAAYSLVSV
jgi:hypothetical protein